MQATIRTYLAVNKCFNRAKVSFGVAPKPRSVASAARNWSRARQRMLSFDRSMRQDSPGQK